MSTTHYSVKSWTEASAKTLKCCLLFESNRLMVTNLGADIMVARILNEKGSKIKMLTG